MVHHFIREKRLVVQNKRDGVLSRDILGGHDREFMPRNIAREFNAANASTRNGTAHCSAVQHAGKVHVVDILRLARDLLTAFFAENWSSNHLHGDRLFNYCTTNEPDLC